MTPQSTQVTIVDQEAKDVGAPRSLRRLLGIFDVLSTAASGMTLTELSDTIGAPKSSLLNLLKPLVSDGYLIHGSGNYSLGPSMYRLAAGILSNWNFSNLIRPFMQDLSKQTGETVILGVMSRETESMTYVEIIEGPHPIRYHIPVGFTRALYANGSGKLLLAFADKEWCEDYLSTVVFKVKTNAPINRTLLRRELAAIQKEGISCSIDFYIKGVSSIAAPVFNANGECVASLTAVGPTDRVVKDLDGLKKIVKDVAAKASGIVSH